MIPRNIKLADPAFHSPAPVDLLLGAGVALSLLSVGQVNLSSPAGPDLYLQKTRLGWVIGGSAPSERPVRGSSCHTSATLQFDLARFWEIEEGPQASHLSDADSMCEAHFKENTIRTTDGRYVVALPFNQQQNQLGESKSGALKRFLSLERKLQRDPSLKHAYHAVIQEYLDLGHMSKIPNDQLLTHNCYYLPHHGVTKFTSQTTKLRVVFDASATTTAGISLNDTLYTGPKIQDDLLYILLRFRIHRYVLTGDIEKMYRQFFVRQEDRKYQRILWRDSSGKINTYQLNTVTFGLSAAPYLAIRCLTQLARDEGHRFPLASKILTCDFYVDDALTGASTVQETLHIRDELTQVLKSAGLHVRQWASNDRSLLQGLSTQAINKQLHLGESDTFKTLGIVWNSSDDSIAYSVKTLSSTHHVTKRSISSETARIYDPLGLLAPVIITAKIMLQKIWTMKIDWDESLPMSIHTEWMQYYRQLPVLNNITFNRKTVIDSAIKTELHGFCDASERAYGACLYLRSVDANGNVRTNILIAKSKVAPLKTQTIPRLELCGALLLSSLATTVQRALHITVDRTIFWTDSTIVLHWLESSPHLLKTFVANRVSEIQNKTNIANWRHVPTNDNPADLISRGQSPEEFLRPSIWTYGPEWLCKDETHWPTWEMTIPSVLPEQKAILCLTTTHVDIPILERYSSWEKMRRITARCLRWRRISTTKGPLTSTEINYVHNVIIKLIQRLHFTKELQQIRNNRTHTIKGKLQRLSPFVDQNGILRVGGRLKHSPMPFHQKHPIILPKTNTTRLIIESEHRAQLHAGVQATLYAVRIKYWPIDGRSQVWQTLKHCARCCRAHPPPVEYIMGDLPKARVTETRPFTNTGVDYCGPFFIKERNHRNRKRVKVYVAVFVCLATQGSTSGSYPNDLLVLTPGHFLIGDSLTCVRERDFRDTSTNRLSSWQQIQKVKQHFWTRWHREYLNELTTRSKWTSSSPTIKKGTIVLLREDNVSSMQWPLGRVVKVHPGADGIVRVATVKTATTVLERNVRKLVPLPMQVDKDDNSEQPSASEHPSASEQTSCNQ
ncbi:uncharacterized protein LOC122403827 [Colletes gigas]|uniref:uncharacterized protein LOC122403827 n=1 Tax=Colletes gigas TaxID=935657 RepID=UPI001C9A3676|nr:uncharacterized protein LOC122403827 [Colletes gigas]